MPDLTVMATRYTYTTRPEGDPNRSQYTVLVEYRGDGNWVVCQGGMCLDADGDWDADVRWGDRSERWKAAHRFDLATAQDLAERIVLRLAGGHYWPVAEGRCVRCGLPRSEVSESMDCETVQRVS